MNTPNRNNAECVANISGMRKFRAVILLIAAVFMVGAFSVKPVSAATYKTYKIYFYANGGSYTGGSTVRRATRKTTKSYVDYTIPTTKPTRSGYYFAGWTKSSAGTGTVYAIGKTIRVTSSSPIVRYYAKWKKIYKYTVKYNANGGSGSSTGKTLTSLLTSRTYTLSSTKPTRSGYTFIEWNTKADGSGTAYQPGEKITIKRASSTTTSTTKTLYAIWVKTSSASSVISVAEKYIAMATKIANCSKVGYTYAGRFWFNGGSDWGVDCASYVFYALYYSGFLNDCDKYEAFGTDDEGSILLAHGFEEVPVSEAQRGDILLVTRYERNSGTGHTEIYLGDGKSIGAHSNYDKVAGDSEDNEVSVVSCTPTAKYYHCFRLKSTTKAKTAPTMPYSLSN